jgi:hypothetical protein
MMQRHIIELISITREKFSLLEIIECQASSIMLFKQETENRKSNTCNDHFLKIENKQTAHLACNMKEPTSHFKGE